MDGILEEAGMVFQGQGIVNEDRADLRAGFVPMASPGVGVGRIGPLAEAKWETTSLTTEPPIRMRISDWRCSSPNMGQNQT